MNITAHIRSGAFVCLYSAGVIASGPRAVAGVPHSGES